MLVVRQMDDRFDKETDEILEEMTERVKQVYQQANQEATDRLVAFWNEFLEEDRRMQKLRDNALIEESDYLAWRRNMIVQSHQYEGVCNAIVNDLVYADEIAAGIVNGNLPDIYSLNLNGAQYDICRELGRDFDPTFTIYDRYTVQRLMRDGESLFPTANVDLTSDQQYVRRHIQNSITQGIIQGESIDDIARRMEGVSQISYNSAVRTARTLTTSAQNAGRVDSYYHAQSMGIDLQQEWMATVDAKTRDSHRLLDGTRVDVGHKFPNGCRYPGDPDGPAGEIYNCRCTIVAALRGYQYNNPDRWTNLPAGMTYDEWKHEHESPDDRGSRGHVHNRVPYQHKGILTDRGREFVTRDLNVSPERAQQYTSALFEFTHNNDQSPLVVNTLDEFINVSPMWDAGPLFRGMGVHESDYLDMLSRIERGIPIDMHGLSSWSSDQEIAGLYAQPRVRGRDYDHGVLFLTNSSSFDNCTSIRHLSNVQREDEVLASSDSVFLATGYEYATHSNILFIYGDIHRKE